MIIYGAVNPADGTSAATPTFAAIMSLLNSQQLKAGKKPLGFLNPWLYQTWEKTRADASPAFYDVMVGNNFEGCCPGNATCGFSCGKWRV